MKFRTIFAFFNVILLLAITFVFLLPMFIIGDSYLSTFWSSNWYFLVLFVVMAIVFNGFFIINWKLFLLLEKQSWNELASYLWNKKLSKNHFSKRYIKLFINASMLAGNISQITELENTLRTKNPKMLKNQALLFGAVKVLSNDYHGASLFYAEYVEQSGLENPEWVSFYYSFVLILERSIDQAARRLEKLLNSKDPIIIAFSAWLLSSMCMKELEGAIPADEAENRKNAISLAKNKIKASFTREKWNQEVEKSKTEIHIIIISKILDEASEWIYS